MKTSAIIDRAFSADNTPAIGSITKDQAEFICDVISRQKPETVVEVGVASGRSSAVMGLCLSENGRGKLHGFDFSDAYYGDQNLPVGFLINEVMEPAEQLHVEININSFSFEVGKKLQGAKIDVAFIDANHQHPWPTLDSIALLPFLSEDAIVLHHDLRLFANPDYQHGVGPKFVYDNVPRDRVVLPAGIDPSNRVTYNMFGVKYMGDYRQYAEELADALLMPQTLCRKIEKPVLDTITQFVDEYFSGTRLVETWATVRKNL